MRGLFEGSEGPRRTSTAPTLSHCTCSRAGDRKGPLAVRAVERDARLPAGEHHRRRRRPLASVPPSSRPDSMPADSRVASAHSWRVPASLCSAAASRPASMIASASSPAGLQPSARRNRRQRRPRGGGASGPAREPGHVGAAHFGCSGRCGDRRGGSRVGTRIRMPPQGNMRTELLLLDAVAEVELDRPTGLRQRAPMPTPWKMVMPCRSLVAVPASQNSATPLGTEPVLVLETRRAEVARRQHAGAAGRADRLVAVTAHRVRAAGTEAQRGGHVLRAGAGHVRAQFRAGHHEVARAHRDVLADTPVQPQEGGVRHQVLDRHADRVLITLPRRGKTGLSTSRRVREGRHQRARDLLLFPSGISRS